jgi:hypothetical protein
MKLNINPLILRELEFYTIEIILKGYQEHLEKENKEYERQQKESDTKYSSQSYKPPSNPYGDFKTPKFDMPSMPKFTPPKL